MIYSGTLGIKTGTNTINRGPLNAPSISRGRKHPGGPSTLNDGVERGGGGLPPRSSWGHFGGRGLSWCWLMMVSPIVGRSDLSRGGASPEREREMRIVC